MNKIKSIFLSESLQSLDCRRPWQIHSWNPWLHFPADQRDPFQRPSFHLIHACERCDAKLRLFASTWHYLWTKKWQSMMSLLNLAIKHKTVNLKMSVWSLGLGLDKGQWHCWDRNVRLYWVETFINDVSTVKSRVSLFAIIGWKKEQDQSNKISNFRLNIILLEYWKTIV